MNTYLKNKKLFLLLFFVLLFIPFKASALVLKDNVDIPTTNQYTSGTLSNNGINYIGQMNFNSPLVANDYPYDFIGIKINRFNFLKETDFSVDNPYLAGNYGTLYLECVQWENQNVCKKYTLGNSINSFPQTLSGNIESSDITISIIMYGTKTSSCWFDSSLSDNIFVCPLYKNETYTHLTILVAKNGTENVTYNIEYSLNKFFFNYDSTEIVNGLLGVQTNISNTTTAIEQQTQQQAQQNAYVQNTSTSGAQSTANTEITALSNELTQHMSQFSELTQLVVSPITLFMELNNDVCVPLTLNVPFVGGTAVLPCIKPIMQQYFGGLYSVFTTVISAIICYWVFVKTVALIKSFLDADDDKIEVIDL